MALHFLRYMSQIRISKHICLCVSIHLYLRMWSHFCSTSSLLEMFCNTFPVYESKLSHRNLNYIMKFYLNHVERIWSKETWITPSESKHTNWIHHGQICTIKISIMRIRIKTNPLLKQVINITHFPKYHDRWAKTEMINLNIFPYFLTDFLKVKKTTHENIQFLVCEILIFDK